MKTVFFGPFIGEFGWELLFWQGWVRKMCKFDFKGYQKIAASFPGRQAFYPYVDEFWDLPEWFLKLNTSGHGYFTDGWRQGYPGRQLEIEENFKILSLLSIFYPPISIRYKLSLLLKNHFIKPKRWIEQPLNSPDIEPLAEKVLQDYKDKLPKNTIYFTPWKDNYYKKNNLKFGLHLDSNIVPKSDIDFTTKIEFSQQLLEYINPSITGEKLLKQIYKGRKEIIAIFPRYRNIRREDKNWPEENYLNLIEKIQKNLPQYQLAILGEPNGAYFTNNIPQNCIDFINIPQKHRMDIQVAALKQSRIALGSMSGALLVALASGCPALIWGYQQSQARYYHENFMNTPMLYYADINPSIDICYKLLLNLLNIS